MHTAGAMLRCPVQRRQFTSHLPGRDQGMGGCVAPGYRVRDPWGNLLEPDVVACTPAYDCTEMIKATGITRTQIDGTVTPTAFAQLQDKVRELEIRIDAIEGKSSQPSRVD